MPGWNPKAPTARLHPSLGQRRIVAELDAEASQMEAVTWRQDGYAQPDRTVLGLGGERTLLNDPARLASVTVDENYIAVSQDAAWLTYSPAERALVMVNKKIRRSPRSRCQPLWLAVSTQPTGTRSIDCLFAVASAA